MTTTPFLVFTDTSGAGSGMRSGIGAHAVVVDTKPLLPHPVYLLGVEYFNLLDEFVEHPGRQLAVRCLYLLGVSNHGLYKLVLELTGKLGQPPDLT